jgi:aromatic-L-amino-acid decarboxylase
MDVDAAEIARYGEMLNTLGRAFDELIKYEHPDAVRSRASWQAKLTTPLPQSGIGIDAVMEQLTTVLIPNGGSMVRPGFTGFITTGPTTMGVMAACAASLAAPQRQTIHAFNLVEELSLEWLAELLGLPANMKGLYSSGGSVANLVALGAARQWAFEQQGLDPAAQGCQRDCVIYSSDQSHHTIRRSAGVLGLGRNNVINIATDPLGRIIPAELERQILMDLAAGKLPIAIVASAGTTNTGSIDPLQALGELARQYEIWFHIDGAYGLYGILDEQVSELYQGLALADSVIVDPHKWMGASVGISATFVRDRDILYRAFTQEPAHYLEGSMNESRVTHSADSLGLPYGDFGVELSSPSRGVVVWAMLQEIGVEGMRDRVVRHNRMARRVADRARADHRLELLMEPTLSICCFRYIAPGVTDLDELNRTIYRQLLQGNVHMPSTTVVAGCLAIRPCFVGAATSFEYADGLVDEVLRIGDAISQAEPG